MADRPVVAIILGWRWFGGLFGGISVILSFGRSFGGVLGQVISGRLFLLVSLISVTFAAHLLIFKPDGPRVRRPKAHH